MAKRTHKDVEFVVEQSGGREDSKVYKSFDEAAGMAVVKSLASGKTYYLDVIIWSEAGARWYGGGAAVDDYRDDPEASIFERIVVKADSRGRIP
jgi:hypothetical protein